MIVKFVFSRWCNAVARYVSEVLEVWLVETQLDLLRKKKEIGFNFKEITLKSHYDDCFCVAVESISTKYSSYVALDICIYF